MKNYLLFFIFSLLLYQGQSQELERQVIANATHNAESGNLTLNGTLGETAITTLESSSGLTVGQGFHQGSLMVTNTYQAFSDLTFEVFPNPTADAVLITTSAEQPFTATIYDLNGRALILQELEFPIKRTPIRLRDFAAGHYFLKITDENGTPIFNSTIQKIDQ